jgi:hypothetical protein
VGRAVARLPLCPLPTEEELNATEDRAQAILSDRGLWKGTRDVARGELAWARACRRLRTRPAPTTLPVRVSSLGIGLGDGTVALIGLPGEIFAEIGHRIRDAVPNAWPVGYANGNVGYLYPDAALAEGGYEVDIAYRLYGERQAGPGTADALVTAAAQAVR